MHGPLAYMIGHSSADEHPYTFGSPKDLAVLDGPELLFTHWGTGSPGTRKRLPVIYPSAVNYKHNYI